MSDIYDEIREERARQDAKWGKQRDNHPFEWMVILGEEFGEACKASWESQQYLDGKTLDDYRDELIQVAAVAVAAIECLDSKEVEETK